MWGNGPAGMGTTVYVSVALFTKSGSTADTTSRLDPVALVSRIVVSIVRATGVGDCGFLLMLMVTLVDAVVSGAAVS